MKTIYLLTITVLARISTSVLTTAEIRVGVPSTFKLVDYDPDNTAKSSGKIGISGLSNNSYFNDDNVYNYSVTEVIERVQVTDSQELLNKKSLLNIICRNDSNHYITKAKRGSCIYAVNQKSATELNDATFYFIYKYSQTTLVEMFEQNPPYINGVQWQLDMMIKITKAVQAFHRLGFVHRDITPDSIMFLNDINEPIQYPILISFENAVPLNDPTSNPVAANFFTPSFREAEPANPKLDVYSLGRLFYVMMNHYFAAKNGQYYFYSCKEETKHGISKYYCAIFEQLFKLMMSEDISKIPSIDNVLLGLRNIKRALNEQLDNNYLTAKNMLETGKRINSQQKEVDLSEEWRQAAQDEINNSYLYGHYVRDVYNRIATVYPNESDQRKADFYSEHSEMINKLKQNGVIARILI